MNRLLQITLLITLLWLSQSCKHDTTDTPVVTPTQDLTVSKKDVFQYEILTFKYDSTVNYNANVYDAEIGGTKLKIGRVDNNFSFVMPSVGAGPQTLEVLIEKKKVRIEYTVKQAQQVSDVNGYTNKYLTTVDSIVANYSRLLIKGTIRNGSAINQENINLLRSQLQKLQQEWARASDVDKKTFANILYVNDLQIGLGNLRNGGRLAIPSQPQDGCAVRFDTEVVFQLAKILSIASFGSLLYAVPGTQLLGIGLTIVVAKELIDLQSYMIANYDCPAILDGNTEINSSAPGGRLKASTLTVTNDQTTAIIFKANYRSIQAKDQSSSFKVRSSIISSITTFKTIWEAAQKFLISKLAGQPLNINEIKITNQVLPVSPELLAISSVSDPSVRLKSAIASKEKLIVAFTTDKPGITKFTFDVTYDNPGVAKSTTTFDAEIKKTEEEIASVKIDPSSATVVKGESITLTATALTKDQKLTSIDDSRWKWEAVGAVPFTIMASGKNSIVQGINMGRGTLKVTDSKTGLIAIREIEVLSLDASCGDIETMKDNCYGYGDAETLTLFKQDCSINPYITVWVYNLKYMSCTITVTYSGSNACEAKSFKKVQQGPCGNISILRSDIKSCAPINVKVVDENGRTAMISL